MGVADHLNIANGVTVLAHTFVTKSITKAGVYSGIMPMQEHSDSLKFIAKLKKDKMNIEQIKQVLPHRDPFLFLDRVIEISSEEIIAEKTFPKDESFYKGHFPNFPITPGVIILEAMAQACGVLGAYNEKKCIKRFRIFISGYR